VPNNSRNLLSTVIIGGIGTLGFISAISTKPTPVQPDNEPIVISPQPTKIEPKLPQPTKVEPKTTVPKTVTEIKAAFPENRIVNLKRDVTLLDVEGQKRDMARLDAEDQTTDTIKRSYVSGAVTSCTVVSGASMVKDVPMREISCGMHTKGYVALSDIDLKGTLLLAPGSTVIADSYQDCPNQAAGNQGCAEILQSLDMSLQKPELFVPNGEHCVIKSGYVGGVNDGMYEVACASGIKGFLSNDHMRP
jgi:hypothetical protein